LFALRPELIATDVATQTRPTVAAVNCHNAPPSVQSSFSSSYYFQAASTGAAKSMPRIISRRLAYQQRGSDVGEGATADRSIRTRCRQCGEAERSSSRVQIQLRHLRCLFVHTQTSPLKGRDSRTFSMTAARCYHRSHTTCRNCSHLRKFSLSYRVFDRPTHSDYLDYI